jgi:hypothetical protein
VEKEGYSEQKALFSAIREAFPLCGKGSSGARKSLFRDAKEPVPQSGKARSARQQSTIGWTSTSCAKTAKAAHSLIKNIFRRATEVMTAYDTAVARL